MRWRSRSTEMLPRGRAAEREVATALAEPRVLLRVNCCAIGPASLLPEGGTGQPSALLFSRRFDQMAAVAGVSHVQPQLVGLWGVPGETINLQNIFKRSCLFDFTSRCLVPSFPHEVVHGSQSPATHSMSQLFRNCRLSGAESRPECVAALFLPPSWTTSLWSTQPVPDPLGNRGVHWRRFRVLSTCPVTG